MRVEMIGSITGHQVETAEDGTAVYVAPPQRGDVVDVDEDTAAAWIRGGMAKPADDDQTPAEAVQEAVQEAAPVETAAVDTSGRRRSGKQQPSAAADDQIEA
jgi:hypothetical protein